MKLKKEDFFLLVILFVSFLLRFPSLFEPNWYGDEGIYQVIGRAIRAGGLLYQDIWDNKPPLLYLIYALVNGDHFMVRLLSLVFMLLSIIAFYLLAQKLFKKTKAQLFSTTFFALMFSLPFIEGNIANAENFMLLPILLAAFLIVKKVNFQLSTFNFQLLIVGFLLSLAFLIKIVAIFDLAAFLLFLFFIRQWEVKKLGKQIKKFLLDVFPLGLGFFLPVLVTALFFISKGILADFLTATFSQNVGYVAVGNQLLIAQGLLLVKLGLLFSFVAILYWQRRRFTHPQVLILLWLAFSLFNAFFAQRPYIHYLLVLLPSFALLLGLVFEEKSYRWLKLTLVALILLLVSTNFWIYGKTPLYYQNFLSFLLGRISFDSYQSFFAPHVQRDYRVAQFLRGRMLKENEVFIWGDNAQVYTLADKLPPGRFTVAYHITFYKDAIFETKQVLGVKKPKYIVVLKQSPPVEEFLRGYKLTFMIDNAQIYERSPFLP